MSKSKDERGVFWNKVHFACICAGMVALIGFIIFIVFSSTFGESWKRRMKTKVSNMIGGLERTVTAYDYNGNILGSWTGKFDVEENDTKTFFDIDGKRVIIQNAIIINEEQ